MVLRFVAYSLILINIFWRFGSLTYFMASSASNAEIGSNSDSRAATANA